MMTAGRRFKSIFATLLLMTVGGLTAAAQDPSVGYPQGAPPPPNAAGVPNAPGSPDAPGQTNTDPPGRVARIQYMSGQVSIQPGGVNDWVAADLNRPLTTSDRVWTDVNSKAELNVGGGFIRMNSEASLTLTNVSDQNVQLELDQGTLELTVRYLGPGQIYEVDTANLAFTVMKAGVYRFDAFPKEDSTWVTVRKGNGEATGQGVAVKVKSGEQVRFGNGASLQHTAEAAPSPDGFDDWASVRDKRLDSSISAQYVSPGVIGYEDLDANGRWQNTPPYGPVWVPNSVPVGWAPYRYGHWVWVAPWGWTWVDDAPWGFAPFHYGRWVNTGGYWGWAPGPYRAWSPCYSPALVAWVGGPGFGVGFGFGGVGWGIGVNFGWFALGWGEPFYPWYHGWYGHGLSSAYIRNVNITNTHITNITNVTNNYYNHNITNTAYANKTVRGAVTAAPGSAIASGRAMNRAGMAVPSSALMHAPEMRNVNLSPTHSSVLGGQQPRANAVPRSAAAMNHNVVTHATPPTTMMARATAPTIGATSTTRTTSPGNINNTRSTASNPSANSNAPFAVHRPPTAGAATNGTGNVAGHPTTATPTTSASAATHSVPRPPSETQNRSLAGTSNSNAVHNGAAGNSDLGNSRAMHPSTQARTASPSSEVQHSAGTAAPRSEPGAATQPTAPSHQSAPQHSAPAQSKSSSGDRAYGAVPRPPSTYTYHAASTSRPAQYGRSGYANNAGYGSVNRSAGSYNAGSRPYVPSTGSYGNASSSRSSAGAYTMARNGGSSPHYSVPSGNNSGGHYSAPSGGGHSSGGSSHSSGGHGH